MDARDTPYPHRSQSLPSGVHVPGEFFGTPGGRSFDGGLVTPVYQTEYGDGKGNCFQACVASCFDLSLEEVPNFCVMYGDKEWWTELEKWCAARGYAPLTFTFDCGRQTTDEEKLSAFYVDRHVAFILSGENAAGVAHSVVVHNRYIHNPNRRCDGLKTYRDIIAFVALRPGEVRQ